jgi:hypothetical protein
MYSEFLSEKPDGKRTLKIHRYRREDLKERGSKDVNCVHVAQNGNEPSDFINGGGIS